MLLQKRFSLIFLSSRRILLQYTTTRLGQACLFGLLLSQQHQSLNFSPLFSICPNGTKKNCKITKREKLSHISVSQKILMFLLLLQKLWPDCQWICCKTINLEITSLTTKMRCSWCLTSVNWSLIQSSKSQSNSSKWRA